MPMPGRRPVLVSVPSGGVSDDDDAADGAGGISSSEKHEIIYTLRPLKTSK